MASAAQPSTASPTGSRRIWRALKQLFHEMTGATFALLAIAWGNAVVRAYLRDVALWLIALPATLAVMMAFFAWTSFRRARRVS